MSKTINGKKQSNKNLLKILTPSLIILSPIVIFALYNLVSNPILDSVDHNRFKTLDSQMQGLYGKIKLASNNNESWEYTASCDSQLSGDWPTGEYICTTLISTDRTIHSVQELNSLQSKYFSLVNNSNVFVDSSGSNIQSTETFGKNFTVSLAYKDFLEMKSNIKCTYTIQLNQTSGNINYQTNNNSLGNLINDDNGALDITLRCSDIARNYWYNLSPSMSPSVKELER